MLVSLCREPSRFPAFRQTSHSYVFREIAAAIGWNQRVGDTMKNKSGRLDNRQYMANVQVIVEPHH